MAYRPRQLVVNGKRMLETLHRTCEWGAANRWGSAPTETGMSRLTLSDTDRQARDWFGAEMRALGCTVKVDAMGNMFAIRPGQSHGPPTAMGSHLDTQPTGGRYDGILGIQAAVEAMKTVVEAGYETRFPLGVVNWTNEEGARFPKSLHGSSVWSGQLPLADAYAMRDVKDASLTAGAELERIGYKGDVSCDHRQNPLAAHFELHIEQGPLLEGAAQRIGVVSGGQAYKWFNVRLQGRDSHAGTTPFAYRADPVLLAARIIDAADAVAREHGGLATTGIFRLEPGSINTIANNVTFALDIRHVENDALALMASDILAAAGRLAAEAAERSKYATSVEFDLLFDAPATKFHEECIGAVREAALGSCEEREVRDIVSGAGHDSCATATVIPSAMVFVPCKDGLSHNPEEYATPEDCTIGAQVLMDAALLYDSKRTQ